MAQQYAVFRTASDTLAVVIQNDLLDETRTRVVAPLLPKGAAGKPIQNLNPAISVDGKEHILMPQLLATLSLDELGEPVASITEYRDVITRAVDVLMAGV